MSSSTIGITFPVPPKKNGAPYALIPWGVIEPHRADIQRAHGRSLEYLAAHGGIARDELAKIIGEAALPPPPKAEDPK